MGNIPSISNPLKLQHWNRDIGELISTMKITPEFPLEPVYLFSLSSCENLDRINSYVGISGDGSIYSLQYDTFEVEFTYKLDVDSVYNACKISPYELGIIPYEGCSTYYVAKKFNDHFELEEIEYDDPEFFLALPFGTLKNRSIPGGYLVFSSASLNVNWVRPDGTSFYFIIPNLIENVNDCFILNRGGNEKPFVLILIKPYLAFVEITEKDSKIVEMENITDISMGVQLNESTICILQNNCIKKIQINNDLSSSSIDMFETFDEGRTINLTTVIENSLLIYYDNIFCIYDFDKSFQKTSISLPSENHFSFLLPLININQNGSQNLIFVGILNDSKICILRRKRSQENQSEDIEYFFLPKFDDNKIKFCESAFDFSFITVDEKN